MAKHSNQTGDREPIVILDEKPPLPGDVTFVRDAKADEMAELRAMVRTMAKKIEDLEARPVAQAEVVRPSPAAEAHGLPAGLPWSIKVRALRQGHYPDPVRHNDGSITRGITHIRRFGRSDTHPGDEFYIEKPGDFAGGPLGWMELATQPAALMPDAPPTTASKPVQDPLMRGILPASVPPGNPQRTIES